MKRITYLLLAAILAVTAAGCVVYEPGAPYILPVSIIQNNVRITIDPRVELMSIVQYLSSHKDLITTADFAYKEDVDKHFAGFRNHQAVTMYEDLVSTGFRFSIPANFALSLTEGLEIDDNVTLSQHILLSGGSLRNLTEFASALRDFSIKSNFAEFYADHESYYRQNVYQVASLLGKKDYVLELQDYYGMEYNSFNIIPVPLYGGGGGFGPHVERPDRIDVYSILCPFDDQMSGEIPLYGNDSLFRLLQRHEFSHSFVNRITDMHLEEVMQYEYLIEPIQTQMDKLNYGYWVTCLNEHIVRAVTTRLAFTDSRYDGSRALSRELDSGFIYIGVLVDALVEYENNRDIYPDFISFYPRLLEALGDYK